MTVNLEEIKAALQAATPGPWRSETNEVLSSSGLGFNDWICQLWFKDEELMKNHKNNAHLIANAPEWLTSLVAQVEALEAKLQDAEKTLEWYAEEAEEEARSFHFGIECWRTRSGNS